MEQEDRTNLGARILAALRVELRRLVSGDPSERRTPITTATWEAFRIGLACELCRLKAGSKVIVYAAAEWRAYAQFATDPHSLYAEAVSNRFLPDDRRLSSEDEVRLATAGWQPPDRKRHVNWWLDRPLPLSSDNSAQLADLTVIALHDVLHIGEPAALEYRAWNDRMQEALDLPALRAGVEPLFADKSAITQPES